MFVSFVRYAILSAFIYVCLNMSLLCMFLIFLIHVHFYINRVICPCWVPFSKPTLNGVVNRTWSKKTNKSSSVKIDVYIIFDVIIHICLCVFFWIGVTLSPYLSVYVPCDYKANVFIYSNMSLLVYAYTYGLLYNQTQDLFYSCVYCENYV